MTVDEVSGTSTSPPERPAVGHGSAVAVGWREETTAIGVAVVAWAGAVLAPRLGPARAVIVAGLVLVVVGVLALRRPGLAGARFAVAASVLCGGVFLIAGARGVAAADGYRPVPAGSLPSPVEVIGDPEPSGPAGWRVEVRLPDGARVDAVAHGRAATTISRARVGSSLAVEGRLRPVGDRPWLRTRHIVARATITTAEPGAGPGLWRGLVEAVRDRVRAGGDSLDQRPQALYHGLVLGDDRFQPPGQTLSFRLSGLTHLLAVSGQNVAFVLAAAAPMTGRLGQRRRLVAVGVVLVVFALITRLEPSVLRAVSTAGLSAWAALSGRTRSGVGVLATAVTVLILADPFLVDSVGFQLSVAASAGILVLTPTLTRLLPGPSWLVAPLATSLAAQVAVAPLLGHYFGPVSLVAIPANVAAGWAAAAIMIWGMSVGLVAGLLPGPIAAVVQLPVAGLLWWLEAVAALGARAPDPRPHLGLAAVLVGCVLVARVLRPRWPVRLVTVLAAVIVATSVPRAPTVPGSCGPGADWFPAAGGGSPTWVGTAPGEPATGEPATGELSAGESAAAGNHRARSVIVLGGDAGLRSIESCRRAGIRSADLVILRTGGRATGTVVAALREAIDVEVVLAPPMHTVIGARRQVEPVRVVVGRGWLAVTPDPTADGRRLDVVAGP